MFLVVVYTENNGHDSSWATGEMCYLCNTVSVNKCIIIVVIITDAKIIVTLSEKLLQGHFTKKSDICSQAEAVSRVMHGRL